MISGSKISPMDRRFKWLRRVGSLLAALMGIIGGAGLPEDLQTWRGWLAALARAAGGNTGRWVLTLAALAILLIANEDKLRAWRRRGRESSVARDPRSAASEWPKDWVPPVQLADYLRAINATMEENGFGRDPNPQPRKRSLAESINAAVQAKSDLMEGRLEVKRKRLSGWQREQLRQLIQEGEAIDKLNAGLPPARAWSTKVAAWIGRSLDKRSAERFSGPPSDSDFDERLLQRGLHRLRALLLEHIPPGISGDHTPTEALDRFMEIQGVPEERRASIRERAAENTQRGRPKNAGTPAVTSAPPWR